MQTASDRSLPVAARIGCARTSRDREEADLGRPTARQRKPKPDVASGGVDGTDEGSARNGAVHVGSES